MENLREDLLSGLRIHKFDLHTTQESRKGYVEFIKLYTKKSKIKSMKYFHYYFSAFVVTEQFFFESPNYSDRLEICYDLLKHWHFLPGTTFNIAYRIESYEHYFECTLSQLFPYFTPID